MISASLIILVLAGDPHGGEEMQGLLAGQILWVSWAQVFYAALAYAAILFAWFKFKDKRGALFYVLFPVMVTLSVQLVGVYLVFASLIIPAMGAACFLEERRLAAGYVMAMTAILSGLVVSLAADFPAGPTLVCSYAVVCLIFFIVCNSVNRRCIGQKGQ
ncbi:MAG: metal ABC transporter permease [Alphaproteobacteria bacterium]|nr:metal ABC transporter permease [Alphaproteobacteria bacterium]